MKQFSFLRMVVLRVTFLSAGSGAVFDDGGAVWHDGIDRHQAQRRACRHPYCFCGHRSGIYRSRGTGKVTQIESFFH